MDSNNNQPLKKSKFEEFFMGNIFNKIGALFILISVCIFFKMISKYLVFTNEIKLAVCYAIGFAITAWSLKLHREEKMKIFSEVLMGTGFGTLLITTYCGAGILHVFSPPIALSIASLITIMLYFIADKQKTISTIVIGLIGGYMNPVFINYNFNVEFLVWYLIFLNIMSLIFVYRNRKKEIINVINLLITTMFIIVICALGNGIYSLTQMMTFWGIYLIYDIVTIMKEPEKSGNWQNYLNFSILTLLSLILYHNTAEIGIFMAVVAVIYGILGTFFIVKTKEKTNGYIHSCIVAVFISTLLLCLNNSLLMIYLLSLEFLVLTVLGLQFKIKSIFNFGLFFVTVTILKLFFTGEIYNSNYEYPVYNPRILYYICPIMFTGMVSIFAKAFDEKKYFDIFRLLFVSLSFTYMFFETCLSFGTLGISKIYVIFALLILYSLCLKKKIAGSAVFYFSLFLLIFSELIINFLYKGGDMLPVANLRLLPYLMAGVNIYYDMKIDSVNWEKYFAIVLGFLYLHFETANVIHYFNILNIETLVLLVYSGIISIIGILKNEKAFRLTGIWLSILLLPKIFLYCLFNLNIVYKFIIFITTGVVLMAVSYYYNKKK